MENPYIGLGCIYVTNFNLIENIVPTRTAHTNSNLLIIANTAQITCTIYGYIKAQNNFIKDGPKKMALKNAVKDVLWMSYKGTFYLYLTIAITTNLIGFKILIKQAESSYRARF